MNSQNKLNKNYYPIYKFTLFKDLPENEADIVGTTKYFSNF